MMSLLEGSNPLVEGTDFQVDYESGTVLRISSGSSSAIPWSSLPLVITYAAGYAEKPVEQHTVPVAPGPYAITVDNSAEFELDCGVTYAGGAALVAVASGPAPGQYSVAAGEYTFNAADAGAEVVITYAFTQIPDSLVGIVLRLITMRFKQIGRDPTLMERNSQGPAGSERYWVGNLPGQKGPLPPDIMAALESTYRVPRFA
jgi:hypothetical protein